MQQNKLIPIILFIVACGLTWFLFGDIFIHPNHYMMVGSGDGLKIYFDAVWQARWGSGFYFDGMNYPYQEVLAMTGGQAFLGWFFSFIEQNIFPIHHYTIGICNALSLYLLPIGVVVSYKLLNRLNLRPYISAFGALLFIYFSPIITRVSCGHINLGYPIIVPVILLWCFNIYSGKKPFLYTFILFVLLLIIGFNNSYFVVVGAGFVFLAGCVFLLKKQKIAWNYLVASGSATSILFVLLKYLENVKDRVISPWGFEYYVSGLQALFVPQVGETSRWVKPHFFSYKVEQESFIYIGFLAAPIIIFSFIYYLINRKKRDIEIIKHNFVIPFLVSAIIIFTVASGLFFQGHYAWIEAHFPFLLQFRTSGRLAWPMFYMGLLVALYCCQWIYTTWIQYWKKPIRIFVIIAVAGLWIKESGELLERYVYNSKIYRVGNEFGANEMNRMQWKCNIPADSFQAIYLLPVTEQWTDKVYFPNNTASLLYGMKYAYHLHLPLINAMLSRMSYGQTLEAVQFCSSPYIYRDLLDKLPNKKPIVIVTDHHTPLSVGEQYIVAQSKLLFTQDDYIDVYAYYPHQPLDTLQKAFADVQQAASLSTAYQYYNFENGNSKLTPFGNACIFQKSINDSLLLFTTNFQNFDTSQNIILSFWTKSTNQKANNAVVKIVLRNKNGIEYLNTQYNVSEQKEVYKGWIMGKINLGKIKKDNIIEVSGFSENSFFDSFLMQYENKNVGWQINDSIVFYNNYWITKTW